MLTRPGPCALAASTSGRTPGLDLRPPSARGRAAPFSIRALPDGDAASLLPSPASLALLALSAALGYTGWRILLWDYKNRRTDDPNNPDRADSFSIDDRRRAEREREGGGAASADPLLRPTPRWGLPPRAKPPPPPPPSPRVAALVTEGLILVAARSVLDRIGEAAGVVLREEGVMAPPPSSPPALTTLALTASGRREQARALKAAAAAAGSPTPARDALVRVAELAAEGQSLELLKAVKELRDRQRRAAEDGGWGA